ncbi:MAG: family 20 glycosylhydrolase [Oscillospiraceae bacterium]|nr:family 20 glycosylhydrolase [Oscillospiraceae bacterium]
MKKTKKWILAAVSALVLLGAGAGLCFGSLWKNHGEPEVHISNHPGFALLADSYAEGEGAFSLTEATRIFAVTEEAGSPVAEMGAFLSQQLAAEGLLNGQPLPVVYGSADKISGKDIVLELGADDMVAESYSLCVDSSGLRITAGDKRGFMYGSFMLVKLLRANGGTELGACTLTECPESAERVVMLDCGRKYYTKDWICNFIRQCAFMGYNAIELRFSEDQGTRFDIWDPEYYKNNVNGNDFSWICGGYVGSWVKSSYQNYEEMNEYLKATEIHEIMETAAAYEMDVIPAFNGPGHCQYLCRAFGNNSTISLKYNYNGQTYSFRGITENGESVISHSKLLELYPNADFSGIFAGNHITLDVTNPYARAFVLAVVEDYGRFFQQYGCEVIHIGGDEVRLHTNGYGSVDWKDYVQEGYSKYDTCVDYINEETAMLESLGYRVRAYNDFMDYVSDSADYDQHIAYDEDIELSYWICEYDLDTVQPVTHWVGQRKIYNCLQNYCYYSLTENNVGQDGRDAETKHWDFYYSTEDRIYEYWNPTVFQWPEDEGQGCVLSPEEVAGGYFLIWCDNAAQSTQDEIWLGVDETGKYNVIDRMWSNTAKMWTYELNSRMSYEEFSALRELLGCFPGYSAPSEATALPELPVPAAA